MPSKLTILVLFVFIAIFSHAEINIKSFKRLPSDMDARVNFPVKDQNGDFCALIKIETQYEGFSFDGGQLGIVSTKQEIGEIWVYVPWGLKRLTIKHPQLGVLRDYLIPEPIEEATVYEMVLITGRIEVNVIEEIPSQWLTIKSNIPNSMFYIDNNYVETGNEYAGKQMPGHYTYRVEAPLYHPVAGVLEINDQPKEITVELQPAFGYIDITSIPESGATVLINGQPLAETTPLITEALASGVYQVKVFKELYAPLTKEVEVLESKTTKEEFNLIPNFGEISVTAARDAAIYVNNSYKANGAWKGKLGAGVYSIEARLDKYETAKKDIQLTNGDSQVISLDPKPITGSIDVISKPLGATIFIDGKEYGKTPKSIKNLLIGEHTIELSKLGYSQTRKVESIKQGQITTVNVTLLSGTPVEFNSIPAGAEVYIRGEYLGTTPFITGLEKGTYDLDFKKDYFITVSTKITVTSDTVRKQVSLVNKRLDLKFTANPKNSSLTLNNDLEGRAKLIKNLKAGNYQFKLEHPGFNTLHGNIELTEQKQIHFNLNPTEEHTKIKALVKSSLFPGLGQTYLKRYGVDWLMGVAFYGVTGTGIAYYSKTNSTYASYLNESDVDLRNDLYQQMSDELKIAKTCLFSAVGIWCVNMLQTVLMKSDEIRYQNIKPVVIYDSNSNITQTGVTINF